MAGSEREPVTFRGWPKGKNTLADEAALPQGALREALNVDLDDVGKPRRRKGYVRRLAGTSTHSLWSNGSTALFVENGALLQLLPDYATQVVTTGLAPQRRLSYCELNDHVYYSNGAVNGRVNLVTGQHSGWGVPTPASQPALSALAYGALDAGRYQVAVTFLNAAGEESGASLAVLVDVAQGGGVQLANLPQSSAAVTVRIYMSPPNGEELFHHLDLPMGVASGVVTRTIRGKRLETQFLREAPAGQIVRYYNGRLYIADGNIVWYTEALRYGLYAPARNYLPPFPERVTVLEPTRDGLYVVADRTYFLSGADAPQFSLTVAAPHRAVEGSAVQVPAAVFALKALDTVPGEVPYWFGTNGGAIGLPGGLVIPVMQDTVAVAPYESGTTLLREQDGIRQLLTALRGKGEASSFGASDVAVAEVIRNGVVI